MKKKLLLCIIVVGMCTCIFGVRSTPAYIELLDGRLQVNGLYKEQMYYRIHTPRVENGFHKSNIDYWRSVFLIEGLYKLKSDGDLQLNLFAGFRYFYEKSPVIDSDHRRALDNSAYEDYIRPSGDDLITEMYLDIQKGPWQFKVGKQIVVWGETNLKQTADIVNPLDIRHGSPGTENWEEIKIGLWMIRGFYVTDLPGQLNFEFIFNPGDFEMTRIPIESTHYGPHRAKTSFNPRRGYGIYHWVQEKARDDERGFHLRKNWEFGFKIRGYTWNVDWSLFYFNSRNDEMTANPSRLTAYTLPYVQAGIRSILTGSRINPEGPDRKVFNYKRFEVLGATFQTRFETFPVSEWRLELFYEIGRPFNKGTNADSSEIYAEVRRDTGGFGLEARDRFTIPYFTHNWFDDKKMSISITLFYEKIFNHDGDLIVRGGRGHRPGDSHAAEIAYSISQYWLHSKWFTMVTGSYNFIGKFFVCPIIGYAPGRHWRFEGGIPIYGSSANRNMGSHDKDSILFRVRYEF
ncbi:DUF1302 family protein [Thermodesulfobacteriota bacterium]